MKGFSRSGFIAIVLTLAGLLALPGLASACTAQCVQVDGGGLFCRQCEDVGEYTGATCENSGSCGCFYTQNTCGLFASGIQSDGRWADLGLAAYSVAPRCEAEPAAEPALN